MIFLRLATSSEHQKSIVLILNVIHFIRDISIWGPSIDPWGTVAGIIMNSAKFIRRYGFVCMLSSVLSHWAVLFAIEFHKRWVKVGLVVDLGFPDGMKELYVVFLSPTTEDEFLRDEQMTAGQTFFTLHVVATLGACVVSRVAIVMVWCGIIWVFSVYKITQCFTKLFWIKQPLRLLLFLL